MTPTNDWLARLDGKMDRMLDSQAKAATQIALNKSGIASNKSDVGSINRRLDKKSNRTWSFAVRVFAPIIGGVIGAMSAMFFQKGGH